eukprot:5785336-Ditylum_brightwellii.AAC.1
MEMKQRVTLNKQYIKYCLGVGLKQKKFHSSDIWKYMPDILEGKRRKMKYRRREKKRSRGKIKKEMIDGNKET